jgi:hypothetical protein
MPLEDQHGMVHVLPVGAIEETELLLAVGGIVGGVEIEQDLAALADLVATEANELLAPKLAQANQIASTSRIFPTTEGRLRTQSIAQFLIGDDLQQRIVTQTISVIGILVAGDNLIEALPQQGPGVMPHPTLLSAIPEESGPIVAQLMTLVEGPQWQQTGVASDLATGEISTDGLMTIEGEAQLW